MVFRARFGLLSVLTGFDSLFVRCALITELRSAGMEFVDGDDSSILLCMANGAVPDKGKGFSTEI
jgi:hypothetical protein